MPAVIPEVVSEALTTIITWSNRVASETVKADRAELAKQQQKLDDYAAMEARLAQVQAERDQARDQHATERTLWQQTLSDQKDLLAQTERDLSVAQNEVKIQQALNEHQASTLAQHVQIIDEQKVEIKSRDECVAQLYQAQLAAMANESELKSRLKEVQSQLESMQRRQATLAQERDELQRKYQVIKDEAMAADYQVQQQLTTIEVMKQTQASLEADKGRLAEDLTLQKAQTEALQRQLDEQRLVIDRLSRGFELTQEQDGLGED